MKKVDINGVIQTLTDEEFDAMFPPIDIPEQSEPTADEVLNALLGVAE